MLLDHLSWKDREEIERLHSTNQELSRSLLESQEQILQSQQTLQELEAKNHSLQRQLFSEMSKRIGQQSSGNFRDVEESRSEHQVLFPFCHE
jgi:hypothetical protein